MTLSRDELFKCCDRFTNELIDALKVLQSPLSWTIEPIKSVSHGVVALAYDGNYELYVRGAPYANRQSPWVHQVWFGHKFIYTLDENCPSALMALVNTEKVVSDHRVKRGMS